LASFRISTSGTQIICKTPPLAASLEILFFTRFAQDKIIPKQKKGLIVIIILLCEIHLWSKKK